MTLIPFENMDEYKGNQTSLYFFPFRVFSTETFPRGTVGFTVGNKIWLTKVDYRLETTTLMRSLISYIIQSPDSISFTASQEDKVTFAVEVIAATGVIYVAEVGSFTVAGENLSEGKSFYYLKGEVKGRQHLPLNNSIVQTLHYLRMIHFSVNPKFEQGILNIKSDQIVAVINPKIWVVKTARDEEVLMLVSGSSCYLTNIKPSAKAIKAAGIFNQYHTQIRHEYPDVMKPALLSKSIFAAVYNVIRSTVVIRPAYFCRNLDGSYRIVHRTFLRTDRRFTIAPHLVKLAAEPLLDLELISTRKAA